MPHHEQIAKEKSEILKATPGKPGDHPARVSTFSSDLINCLNEGSTYKYNFAHALDSAAAFFLSDNVGLPAIAHYFKLVAVAQRADAFNIVLFVAKRGGCPEIRAVGHLKIEEWSKKDRSDVLHAFACAMATAKVGLAFTNQAFQQASKHHDAEAAAFLQQAAFAWAEQVHEWSSFVDHLKLVHDDKHAIKNFDRALAASPRLMDLAKAAAIEAVAPPELQMGVYNRKRACQSKSFEDFLASA